MLNVVGANQVTNGSGIRLTSAGVFNMLIKNQVSGGSNGISLERAFFELVYGNRVSNVSGYGIYSGDWLYPMENQAGLIAESGGGHLLYRNTLIENKLNASDNWGDIYGVANIWDDGAFGNYFSDYDEPSEGCQDNDGNRICDTPFQIPGEPGGLDNYPVMDPIMD
jgi:hypothetical protein